MGSTGGRKEGCSTSICFVHWERVKRGWGQKSEQNSEQVIYHRSGDEAGGLDSEERRESEGLSLPNCLAGLYVSLTGWPW